MSVPDSKLSMLYRLEFQHKPLKVSRALGQGSLGSPGFQRSGGILAHEAN